jgi:hypothetical protein
VSRGADPSGGQILRVVLLPLVIMALLSHARDREPARRGWSEC